MQFLAISAALFAALTTAAPAATPTNPAHSTSAPDPNTYENIDIADFYVRKNNGIQAAGFQLSGKNATDLTCSASNPVYGDVYTCGESKYRFELLEGETEEFGLRIYHELGFAFGFSGKGDVPTYCRAGGNGPDDFVCQQVNAQTIVIDASVVSP